ncbi:SDR family oxidoreductase [Sphingomonas sp. ID1715]|nr:SDR family oxidoreductase [Sphingomonas sp. ID1715]NNM75537.1 SDR family oxidoreductase [Sphingomonas sp. ID1715]
MRLDGKIALVTGAARGIGAGIARAFVREGATVWLTDIDEAGDVARGLGPNARSAVLDVRDESAWDQTVATLLARDGRLDILVNNAGVTGFETGTGPHDPENASLAEWHAVHAVNLDGTFLGCRAAIRAMRPQGTGSIINISSRSGLVGIPGAAAYASSKAAIRNHSKSVALWCAQQGLRIRCNSVHPAAVLTPMWEKLIGNGPDRESRMAAMVADTPLKRFGTVEEVAALCVYLASDESAYATGAEFTLDGGLLAGSAVSPGD